MAYVASGYYTEGYVQEGIRVDWPNKNIIINKADMTLVQLSPVEVYQLDINSFRLNLRDLEDDATGIAYPTTHTHTPPVTTGGVTLARVVEIINDYTLEFEDAQYAVNIIGGNSNLADRVIANQVSIRTANSAGLVQTAEIENATYAGGVAFNLNEGVAGTTYPIGTTTDPVNNLADTLLIQSIKRLPQKMYIQGLTNFGPADVLTDWVFEGISNWNDHVHTFSGGVFTNSRLLNLHVAGTYYGLTTAVNCRFGGTVVASGDMVDSYFTGTLTANGGLEIINGNSTSSTATPVFDGAGAHSIQIRGYNGDLVISNITDPAQVVTIDLASGKITLDATCSAGYIEVRGNGDFVDNSTGATVVSTGFAADALQHASFDGGVTIDIDNGVLGTDYPAGTGREPVNNIPDALTIAVERGFDKLFIKGDLTIQSGIDVGGYHIYGEGASLNLSQTTVTLEDGAGSHLSHWYGCKITGKQGGEAFYHHCIIDELWNAHCIYEECGFLSPSIGTFTLQQSSGPSSGHTSYLKNCYSDEGQVVVDRTGVKISQRWSDFTGNLKFVNQQDPTTGDVWVHLVGGSIEIDSTCTTGTFHITGDGAIINNTGGAVVKTGVLQKIDDARIAVEALRPTHQGYGSTIYVDPVGGNDANEGETKVTAVATFARAHDLVHDGENDVILFTNTSSAGYSHAEEMVCTKNNVHIRATSRDITFKAANSNATILTIGDATGTNGYGCSVSGMLIDGDRNGATTAEYCIVVNGKFCALNHVWAKQATIDCVQFRGGDYHTILDGEIEKADRHGVSMFDAGLPSGSPREISIYGRTNIYLNDGDGIHVDAAIGESGSTTRIIRILSAEVTDNSGYGIHASADVTGLTVGTDVLLHGNNGGDVNPQTQILTTSQYNENDSRVADTAQVIRYAVEGREPTHQGYGQQFFITPTGNDQNDGITVDTAFATWTGALSVAVDGRNDIITYVNPTSAVHTHYENFVVNKNNVHLRAASRDIVFKSDDSSDTILTVGDASGTNGYSCSVRGLLIDGNRGNLNNTAGYCMQVNGKFSRLDSLWLKQATLDCLRINGGDYHVIEDAEFEKADRHGISTFDAGLPSGSPREISVIGRSNIYLNDGDGIHLGVSAVPVLGSTTRLIRILSGEITRNVGFAIHAEAEVDGLTIGSEAVLHDNNGGHGQPQLNILTAEVHNTPEEARDNLIEDMETAGIGASEADIHVALDSYSNKSNWQLDPAELHTSLDSYTNKADWQLDSSELHTSLDSYPNKANWQMSQAELHTGLDAYANKSDWKASPADLTPVLNAIAALNDLSLLQIEGSTVLAKESTLTTITGIVSAIPSDYVSLTPVLTAISQLNDVTPAEVRAAFNAADFKDKNTELEVHTWLDSYVNKDNWKAAPLTSQQITDAVWNTEI